MAKTPALMLLGTGSDVGKSLVVAGLCRAFTRRGLRVAPFKPQNMSNNAAVTLDGGEIGRAQALQAKACGLRPHTDMNPVLLKPQSETGAQVVVQGKVWGSARGAEYQAIKGQLMPAVLESYSRISADVDLMLVEGAGSASELNLRTGDIANWGFARAAQIPTVLVGDIDRGGVIANIIGTHRLISREDRAILRGFLINKFRGDTSLFASGSTLIQQETGLRDLGIVPFFPAARDLPAEDVLALDQSQSSGSQSTRVKIAVLRIGRISNFDDFDPLAAEPEVDLVFVQPGETLPVDTDLVILPGSKATLADLAFLRQQGWDIDIAAHVRRGKPVLGICGGYQMLGTHIADPDGIEGPPAEAVGLGLLDVQTVMKGPKTLVEIRGSDIASGEAVAGYEMHMGVTTPTGSAVQPMLRLGSEDDGAVQGVVSGCYLHGLFNEDGFRRSFLRSLDPALQSELAFDQRVEGTLDDLAAHFEEFLDLDAFYDLARAG
ncbi:MAG: cobyric acid synthase [Alphaproteobacteria bacterium]